MPNPTPARPSTGRTPSTSTALPIDTDVIPSQVRAAFDELLVDLHETLERAQKIAWRAERLEGTVDVLLNPYERQDIQDALREALGLPLVHEWLLAAAGYLSEFTGCYPLDEDQARRVWDESTRELEARNLSKRSSWTSASIERRVADAEARLAENAVLIRTLESAVAGATAALDLSETEGVELGLGDGGDSLPA